MQVTAPKFQGILIDLGNKNARLVTADHPQVRPDEIVITDSRGKIVLTSERVARELTEPFSNDPDTFPEQRFSELLSAVLNGRKYTVESAVNTHYTRSMSGMPYGFQDSRSSSDTERTLAFGRKLAAALLQQVQQGVSSVVRQPEILNKYRRWLPSEVTYQGDSLVLQKK